jgi:hypothetical protein
MAEKVTSLNGGHIEIGPRQWQTIDHVATENDQRCEGMNRGDNFDSVSAAFRRIFEIEGCDGDAHGLFLEFYVETGEWGTDEEALRVFHYIGKRALCGIKRTRPN